VAANPDLGSVSKRTQDHRKDSAYQSELVRVTAEELAHCVDSYCGCGREHHEVNTLKRLRARLEADLRTAVTGSN